MASSFMDRVMNYIMAPADHAVVSTERQFSVHGSAAMKLVVISPHSLEKTCQYADSLKAGLVLLVEYGGVDQQSRQTMHDFLDGVCFVLQGSTLSLSTDVVMYMPVSVEASRHITASTQPVHEVYPFDRIVPVKRFSQAASSTTL